MSHKDEDTALDLALDYFAWFMVLWAGLLIARQAWLYFRPPF